MERVSYEVDLRALQPAHIDFDNIEAELHSRFIQQPQPRYGPARYEPLLGGRDRLRRRAKVRAAAGFHFDKDQCRTAFIPADDVHFPAPWATEVPIQNFVSVFAQIAGGKVFAYFAQDVGGVAGPFTRREIASAPLAESFGDESDKDHVV